MAISITATGLATAIKGQLPAAGTTAGQTISDNFATELATAIVNYLSANLQIDPSAIIAPTGGGACSGQGVVK